MVVAERLRRARVEHDAKLRERVWALALRMPAGLRAEARVYVADLLEVAHSVLNGTVYVLEQSVRVSVPVESGAAGLPLVTEYGLSDEAIDAWLIYVAAGGVPVDECWREAGRLLDWGVS